MCSGGHRCLTTVTGKSLLAIPDALELSDLMVAEGRKRAVLPLVGVGLAARLAAASVDHRLGRSRPPDVPAQKANGEAGGTSTDP